MKQLRFDAPAHHVLQEGDQRIPGGAEFTVSNERALELLADPQVPVSEPVSELASLTREELNERARGAGIDSPEGLPNKQAVLDALHPVSDETAEQQ